MMYELGKIMGGEARVKIMRLFLFNAETPFDVDDIVERSRVSRTVARKEANMLAKTGFVKKKNFTKEIVIKPKRRNMEPRIKRKKTSGWMLDIKFPLMRPFKKLLLETNLIQTKDLTDRLQGTGGIKLLVVSGIFVEDEDRKLDVLIVGDRLRRPKIEQAMKIVESEIGKELRYAVFDSKEFQYRLSMYDKLVRDVFDYTHEKLINKLTGITL